jgi:hypothetical protein
MLLSFLCVSQRSSAFFAVKNHFLLKELRELELHAVRCFLLIFAALANARLTRTGSGRLRQPEKF